VGSGGIGAEDCAC